MSGFIALLCVTVWAVVAAVYWQVQAKEAQANLNWWRRHAVQQRQRAEIAETWADQHQRERDAAEAEAQQLRSQAAVLPALGLPMYRYAGNLEELRN